MAHGGRRGGPSALRRRCCGVRGGVRKSCSGETMVEHMLEDEEGLADAQRRSQAEGEQTRSSLLHSDGWEIPQE